MLLEKAKFAIRLAQLCAPRDDLGFVIALVMLAVRRRVACK